MLLSDEVNLLEAVRCGNVNKVKILLAQGVKVDFTDEHQATPLMYAAHQGDVLMVESLLEGGADFNRARQPHGITVLMLAAAANQVKVVKTLLFQAGADVNATNDDGTPAVAIAAYKGYEEIVRLLIDANADINMMDMDGETPLSLAAQMGHTNIMSMLLEAGANPYQGLGALHSAVTYANIRAVHLLIAAGVAVNGLNQEKDTALIYATEKGLSVSDCASTRSRERTLIEILLAAGADVNLPAEDGTTPLMLAACGGDSDLVEILLKAGAAVNTHNVEGETALHFACVEGHFLVVQCLLEAGAQVNCYNQLGDTPLLLATLQGYIEIVPLLLAYGANPRDNNHGETPLALAVTQGYMEMVRILLEAGADANTTVPNGKTALMQAAYDGNVVVVKYLLQAGADVNGIESTGSTALMWATARGHIEVVKELLHTEGIDIHRQNQGGLTAGMLADFNGHHPIVALLEAPEC